jgi:hypothetical protein
LTPEVRPKSSALMMRRVTGQVYQWGRSYRRARALTVFADIMEGCR